MTGVIQEHQQRRWPWHAPGIAPAEGGEASGGRGGGGGSTAGPPPAAATTTRLASPRVWARQEQDGVTRRVAVITTCTSAKGILELLVREGLVSVLD